MGYLFYNKEEDMHPRSRLQIHLPLMKVCLSKSEIGCRSLTNVLKWD